MGGARREIVRRAKIYGFDTGFVAFARGWDSIRDEDRGVLWEHLVLDTLRAAGLENSLTYWRDKSGREIDFVLKRSNGKVDAIECKISPEQFDADFLRHFRSLYPDGENWVVCPMLDETFTRSINGLQVRFMSTRQILDVHAMC